MALPYHSSVSNAAIRKKIGVRASGDLSITMGEVDAVVIEADENILPLLKTEVIDNQ